MKLIISLSALLLASLVVADPVPSTDLKVTKGYFKDSSVLYTSKYDIIKIYVPLNRNTYAKSADSEEIGTSGPSKVFFVEGDLSVDEGSYKGLYVFKEGKAIKVLDNGKDVVATHDNTIIIGATDGIYQFNDEKNTAVRIGEVRDNIEQLAFNNKTNKIVYLDDKNKLYVLSDDFKTSTLVHESGNVEEIVYDYDGNLYGESDKNEFYVYKNGKATKFSGLPTSDGTLLVRPPFALKEGVFLYAEGDVYTLKPNASYEKAKIEFEVHPTAFAPEFGWFQYYALNKKLYELNMIQMFASEEYPELQAYLTAQEKGANE